VWVGDTEVEHLSKRFPLINLLFVHSIWFSVHISFLFFGQDGATVQAQTIANNTQITLNPVNFCENGLPPGTQWSVSVYDNLTHQTLINSSTSFWITFYLPNASYGSYYYKAGTVPGYVFLYNSGQGPFGIYGSTGFPGSDHYSCEVITYSKPNTSAEIFWIEVSAAIIAVFGLLILVSVIGFSER
jgi:hypothetical protein